MMKMMRNKIVQLRAAMKLHSFAGFLKNCHKERKTQKQRLPLFSNFSFRPYYAFDGTIFWRRQSLDYQFNMFFSITCRIFGLQKNLECDKISI